MKVTSKQTIQKQPTKPNKQIESIKNKRTQVTDHSIHKHNCDKHTDRSYNSHETKRTNQRIKQNKQTQKSKETEKGTNTEQ